MAKLIAITKKQLWEDWILSTEDSEKASFTQQEIDTIFVPYINYVKSLPGIKADLIDIRKSNGEMAIIREFDTQEHAENAAAELITNPTNMAVLKMLKLMRDKQAQYGYSYTYDYKVLP